MSDLSFHCAAKEHEACAHKMGEAVTLFRRSSRHAVLCQCTCHTECVVRGAEVPEQVWLAQCTCPGSHAWRDSQTRVQAEMDEHKRRHTEVMQSIDVGRGKSADEIRQMILDGYAARGWEPPTDFGWQSRFVAAATARHGRTPRVLLETARGLRAAKKWLADTRVHGDPPDHDEE